MRCRRRDRHSTLQRFGTDVPGMLVVALATLERAKLGRDGMAAEATAGFVAIAARLLREGERRHRRARADRDALRAAGDGAPSRCRSNQCRAHHLLRRAAVCDFTASRPRIERIFLVGAAPARCRARNAKVGRRLWGTEPNMRPISPSSPTRWCIRNCRTMPGRTDPSTRAASERAWELRTGKMGHPNCNNNIRRCCARRLFRRFVHDAFTSS